MRSRPETRSAITFPLDATASYSALEFSAWRLCLADQMETDYRMVSNSTLILNLKTGTRIMTDFQTGGSGSMTKLSQNGDNDQLEIR